MSSVSQFVFPPFRLDPVNRELLRGQHKLPIRPKTYAVLHHLLSHADRIVSRDELCQAVWPGTVGSEQAPKHCIRELRATLGETAAAPHFIQTVGRWGYRFAQLDGPKAAAVLPYTAGWRVCSPGCAPTVVSFRPDLCRAERGVGLSSSLPGAGAKWRATSGICHG